MKPDYKRLYTDILYKKYPHKMEQCQELLNKNELSVIDILQLNKRVFGETHNEIAGVNQKYRSYSRSDIVHILDHQKKHKLNNSQLANHFKLSRNTVAKWKKTFPEQLITPCSPDP